VPADGFFEWQAEGGRKRPYLFGLRGGGLFAFAGLWEQWRGALQSCAVLTVPANALVRWWGPEFPLASQPHAADNEPVGRAARPATPGPW
jgi:hypothetical protein